jgi:hypothetical protein
MHRKHYLHKNSNKCLVKTVCIARKLRCPVSQLPLGANSASKNPKKVSIEYGKTYYRNSRDKAFGSEKRSFAQHI